MHLPIRIHVFGVLFASVVLTTVALSGCGGATQRIRGTEVRDTARNRDVLKVIEAYRLAVERKDAPALLLMASRNYFEDSATRSAEDDYGFDGLKAVLTGRFQGAESIRYSLRYMRMRHDGSRAFVEAVVHASWTIRDAREELVRRDKRSQEQFVLEYVDDKWKFLSGM